MVFIFRLSHYYSSVMNSKKKYQLLFQLPLKKVTYLLSNYQKIPPIFPEYFMYLFFFSFKNIFTDIQEDEIEEDDDDAKVLFIFHNDCKI